MSLKGAVLEANKKIIDSGLVQLTWGNVSALEKRIGVVLIKPSGVNLNKITEDDITSVSLRTGSVISGKKPSVDTPTHLVLYRNFKNIGAIVHTHSKFATAFAQANREILCLGTTHADYFCGSIPVVDQPDTKDIEDRYEEAIGESIVHFFLEKDIDPSYIPGALCPSHGVFCWGKDLEEAVKNAHVLEILAEMAYYTHSLNQRFDSDRNSRLRKDIMNKHFFRKHGSKKYYGQV